MPQHKFKTIVELDISLELYDLIHLTSRTAKAEYIKCLSVDQLRALATEIYTIDHDSLKNVVKAIIGVLRDINILGDLL